MDPWRAKPRSTQAFRHFIWNEEPAYACSLGFQVVQTRYGSWGGAAASHSRSWKSPVRTSSHTAGLHSWRKARWVKHGKPCSCSWSEKCKVRSSPEAPGMEGPQMLSNPTGVQSGLLVMLTESLLANSVPRKSLRLPGATYCLLAQTSQSVSPVLLPVVFKSENK